jgi:hypothetical protein
MNHALFFHLAELLIKIFLEDLNERISADTSRTIKLLNNIAKVEKRVSITNDTNRKLHGKSLSLVSTISHYIMALHFLELVKVKLPPQFSAIEAF